MQKTSWQSKALQSKPKKAETAVELLHPKSKLHQRQRSPPAAQQLNPQNSKKKARIYSFTLSYTPPEDLLKSPLVPQFPSACACTAHDAQQLTNPSASLRSTRQRLVSHDSISFDWPTYTHMVRLRGNAAQHGRRVAASAWSRAVGEGNGTKQNKNEKPEFLLLLLSAVWAICSPLLPKPPMDPLLHLRQIPPPLPVFATSPMPRGFHVSISCGVDIDLPSTARGVFPSPGWWAHGFRPRGLSIER